MVQDGFPKKVDFSQKKVLKKKEYEAQYRELPKKSKTVNH